MTPESRDFIYLPEQIISIFDIYDIYVKVMNSLTTKICEVAKVTSLKVQGKSVSLISVPYDIISVVETISCQPVSPRKRMLLTTVNRKKS